MCHPQPREPEAIGFAKTLFYQAKPVLSNLRSGTTAEDGHSPAPGGTEDGNTIAMLVTNTAGKRRQKPMPFADAHAALDWCPTHAAMRVYLPSPPITN